MCWRQLELMVGLEHIHSCPQVGELRSDILSLCYNGNKGGAENRLGLCGLSVSCMFNLVALASLTVTLKFALVSNAEWWINWKKEKRCAMWVDRGTWSRVNTLLFLHCTSNMKSCFDGVFFYALPTLPSVSRKRKHFAFILNSLNFSCICKTLLWK